MANEDRPDGGTGEDRPEGEDNPYKGTNEGKFMESLRAFMKQVPSLARDEQLRNDMERVVSEYSGAEAVEADPIYLLHPSEAKVLVEAQQAAAPELAEHPFFKKVAAISRARWSAELQALIDANTYLLQKDLGVNPSIAPPREVLKVVEEAASTAARYAVPPGVVVQLPTRSAPRAEPPGASHLAAFVAAVKRNW